jgi:hypothetical protein
LEIARLIGRIEDWRIRGVIIRGWPVTEKLAHLPQFKNDKAMITGSCD